MRILKIALLIFQLHYAIIVFSKRRSLAQVLLDLLEVSLVECCRYSCCCACCCCNSWLLKMVIRSLSFSNRCNWRRSRKRKLQRRRWFYSASSTTTSSTTSSSTSSSQVLFSTALRQHLHNLVIISNTKAWLFRFFAFCDLKLIFGFLV